MSIEWVMLSNHLILRHPLILLLSIFPSIRVMIWQRSHKIEVVCSKRTQENIHGIRPKVENLKLNKAEFSHGGRALYFGSRFHILARIPGDSVNTLLRWCLNARGSNHPHSAKWWGEGPSGSEKWTCWSGCSPNMAWGLPMSRVMHWGEWPQHLQEAEEQPCSEGQADGR